jgi:hypothetical protein
MPKHSPQLAKLIARCEALDTRRFRQLVEWYLKHKWAVLAVKLQSAAAPKPKKQPAALVAIQEQIVALSAADQSRFIGWIEKRSKEIYEARRGADEDSLTE